MYQDFTAYTKMKHRQFWDGGQEGLTNASFTLHWNHGDPVFSGILDVRIDLPKPRAGYLCAYFRFPEGHFLMKTVVHLLQLTKDLGHLPYHSAYQQRIFFGMWNKCTHPYTTFDQLRPSFCFECTNKSPRFLYIAYFSVYLFLGFVRPRLCTMLYQLNHWQSRSTM